MDIIAIDPGTSHTGIVYMNELRIICCATLPGGKSLPSVRGSQEILHKRSCQIARQVSRWIADKPHDAVVLESFQAWTSRQNAYSHQTPILVGHLENELQGENLIIQTSNILSAQKGSVFDRAGLLAESKLLAKKNGMPIKPLREWLVRSLYEDAPSMNEHHISAVCHGIFYLEGLKEEKW